MVQETHAWIQFGSATYPIPYGSTVRIGRSIESNLRLFEDTSVSRDHCEITSHGTRVEVTDLKSRNGTKLNGHRISSPTELQHRDVITVGESSLIILFELGGDSEDPSSTMQI